MPEIKKILGNEKNIQHFALAAQQGKLSHAYIICGQKGSGKKTFADYMAAGLLCGNNKEDKADDVQSFAPCGGCPSCLKVLSDNHPDLIHVTHKKENVITVGEIREQVVEDIVIKPFYGPYKIYVIEDADKMNVNAQNALLKTMEEPPEYGLLLLLVSNADGLLDTVRSRCITIEMERLADEVVEKALETEHRIEPEPARHAALFARGNLGKAIALAEGRAMAEDRANTVWLMKELKGMDAFKINDQAKMIEAADTQGILDMIRSWFRDVLLLKAAGPEEDLYFPEEAVTIKDQAKHIAFENIETIFRAIDETETELVANVKAEAAVEVMLLKIRQYLAEE